MIEGELDLAKLERDYASKPVFALVRAVRAMRAHWQAPTMETLAGVGRAFAAFTDSANETNSTKDE